nr:YdcF family protein [uncultured Rhodoferax sp.]
MSIRLGRYRRAVVIVVATAMLAFVLASLLLVAAGMRDDIREADVAVVLGNTVNPDGTPSHRLAARLDTAVVLYQRGLFKSILVSGGVGREGFDEAVVMGDYLVKRGVPRASIVLDSLGVTTAATARNTAALAKTHGWSRVLVVSQYFHIPRCRLAFSQAGLGPVYAAHAPYFELRDIYSTAREVVGYAAYLGGARN